MITTTGNTIKDICIYWKEDDDDDDNDDTSNDNNIRDSINK